MSQHRLNAQKNASVQNAARNLLLATLQHACNVATLHPRASCNTATQRNTHPEGVLRCCSCSWACCVDFLGHHAIFCTLHPRARHRWPIRKFLHATRRANAPGRTRDAIHDNDSRGNDTP